MKMGGSAETGKQAETERRERETQDRSCRLVDGWVGSSLKVQQRDERTRGWERIGCGLKPATTLLHEIKSHFFAAREEKEEKKAAKRERGTGSKGEGSRLHKGK